MTFSARTATSLSAAANLEMVDMRQGGRPIAGSFVYEGHRVTTTRHVHDLHQLEYVLQGVLEVETDSSAYIMSARQAAWIPAASDTSARSTRRSGRCRYFCIRCSFNPAIAAPGSSPCRRFSAK